MSVWSRSKRYAGNSEKQFSRSAPSTQSQTMRVFGSVARGENDDSSDVDFLVEFKKGRTLFDLIRLRLALKDLLGIEVEIVTPATLHYLRERVLSEARAL